METIDKVRKAFAQRFGSADEVAAGTSGGRMHYLLPVLIQPEISKVATEDSAWKVAIAVVEWAASEAILLGEAAKIEVIVALPLSVRTTKRRVLRIGGSIPDLVSLTTESRKAAGIAGTYHYRYDDWAHGLELAP